MARYLTADQAVRALKIRRQTLYAYVSRGLIRAESADGDSRRSLYRADDVDALAARKRRGRTPGRAAATALQWGLPVLESAITLVDGGRLYYRGRDAVTLAENGASLEDVARLMWQVRDGFDPFAMPPPAPSAGLQGPPMGRCLALLARRACDDAPRWPTDLDRRHASAADLVRAIAAALGGYAADGGAVHKDLARAWGASRKAADLLRMALVLSADHELNASTFTVRCIASTGASLDAAAAGGLAALSGPLHGGMSARVSVLLGDVERVGDAARVIADRLKRGESFLPGFGHLLYPEGDPRAQAILERLDFDDDLPRAVAAIGGPPPNLDYALAALQRRYDLPEDSPFVLFAAGRTVGWAAHAMEQQDKGTLIRPRARYAGPAPSSSRPAASAGRRSAPPG